jgi:hypothetical protein
VKHAQQMKAESENREAHEKLDRHVKKTASDGFKKISTFFIEPFCCTDSLVALPERQLHA